MKIKFGNQSLTPDEWGRKLGLSGDAVLNRIHRGWTVARALTTPRQKSGAAMRPHIDREVRGRK